MRTILGTPHPRALCIGQEPSLSDCYSNGDDLSENVYRASIGSYMRWGHVTMVIAPMAMPVVFHPIILAHQNVKECYKAITGHTLHGWGLHLYGAISD